MKESPTGSTEFAAQARTPALRKKADRPGCADAAHPERARACAGARAGRSAAPRRRPRTIIAGVEELIEQADEANDALVTDEQKVTDRIAADAGRVAAGGKRLVVIVLALALPARRLREPRDGPPAGSGRAPPAGRRTRHLGRRPRPGRRRQVAGELGATRRRSATWSPTCATWSRPASGSPTATLPSTSSPSPLTTRSATRWAA